MSSAAPLPAPGEMVRLRSRCYLVEGLTPPPAPGEAHLVRLACLDDDAQGEPLEVLWEAELDAERLTAETWADLGKRDFDPRPLFSAWLHTLRWGAVTATDPRLLQSPFRAGIELHAWQIEPLRKALLLPRVNLFIADDVGLGKTIEAGLIAAELLLRRKVRDIVVACPPGVLLQWQEEMESRFGLRFEIVDRAFVARTRRERGWAANPWTAHTRLLVSQRLLIDEDYAAPLRDWLGELRPGSLFILDEAHNAAPASGARYAIDSQLTRALREIAPRFEHRLFLSATPHNGHSNSFSALLELLDPQRFCRGVPVSRKGPLEEVMVRRLKEDIRLVDGGFPRRVIEQIDLDAPLEAPEVKLSLLLDEYRGLREGRLADQGKRRQAAAMLLVTGLQQRLLSSVEAFARTLRVHKQTLERAARDDAASRRASFPLLTASPGLDDDDATLPEDERAAAEEAEFAAATRAAALGLTPREAVLLAAMDALAQQSRALADARVAWLRAWIERELCPGGRWNERRVLVFTEYDDTKRYLVAQLEAALPAASGRIAVFHGPTPPARREELKRAFNTEPTKHPLRILIATDAAREGVNLQSHCADLFHFDVPWNPGRLEQRNGRIDRKLQPSPEVRCRYFVYLNRPEDRVLRALVRKTETIRKELGSLGSVLDARLARTLERGIRHATSAVLASEVESADLDSRDKSATREELDGEAALRKAEVEACLAPLRAQLETSRKASGFDTGQFRAALDAALALNGAPPLASAGDGAWSFPAIDAQQGADPTWADTLDALRVPRKRDQMPWEWRRDAPLRPVVFEAPKKMTDEVVQLHLAHRVVDRLLNRFRAQGFVHHDLTRACLAITESAEPRILLIGRLSLYGARAARLHEELVVIAAVWSEPGARKAALRVESKLGELEALHLLERALGPGGDRPIAKEITAKLKRAAARDVAELLPQLEARGAKLREAAEKQLAARGEDEARKMREILAAQRGRIEATLRRFEDRQQSFEFDDGERRQLESNQRHWRDRLGRIDRELEDEPRRIREVYAVSAARLEPAGLVYLWPVTG